VNARTGKVGDMMEEVIEPLAVKEEIIRAATEASCMILRVDDILASGKSKGPAGPPPGAGGYGGMGE
jgi:chaperonin GroEL (HSP60 family)